MAFSFPHYPQNHTTEFNVGCFFLLFPLCAIFKLIYNRCLRFVAKYIQKEAKCLKDCCHHSVESKHPLAENNRLYTICMWYCTGWIRISM